MSHLLFVNDSIIFCKTDLDTNKEIQIVLNSYGRVLGQRINFEKTTMVFSRNVQANTKVELTTLWNTSITQQYDIYLGLPPSW